MHLSPDAVDALAVSTTERNPAEILVRLPNRKLDRKLYQEVNAFLEEIGGQWNRHRKAHVFTADPTDAIDLACDSGEFINARKDLSYFATPDELAARLVAEAEIEPNSSVLEPSAGTGSIAKQVIHFTQALTCVEIHAPFRKILRELGFTVADEPDFLKYSGGPFDRICMNPPFARGTDLKHVMHAWGLLKPSGRLVAIMDSGIRHRSNKASAAFRELVAAHGTMENLEAGSFEEAGTKVGTVMVTLDRR